MASRLDNAKIMTAARTDNRLPEAAAMAVVSKDTIIQARVILRLGTADEVAAVESGKVGFREIANSIRKRNPRQVRGPGHAIKTDAEVERISNFRIRGQIMKNLRRAINDLANMPAMPEVQATLKRFRNHTYGELRVPEAMKFLEEFSHAYAEERANGARDDHAGNGGKVTGTQHPKPANL